MSKKEQETMEKQSEELKDQQQDSRETQAGSGQEEAGKGASEEKKAKKPKKSLLRKKKDDSKKLKDEIRELNIQVGELKDKYLRLFAEFDNFKKRTIREKLELMNTASQDIMVALLPILDDFERAKKSADDPDTDESFSEGVALVYNRLFSVLKSKGLEPMDTDHAPFDAELHEAISEIPAPTEELKGKILDTIEKGYYLNDKIIRHARVVVGR